MEASLGAAGFTPVGRTLPPSPLGLDKINRMVSPMCPGKVMDYGGGRKTLALSWQVAKKKSRTDSSHNVRDPIGGLHPLQGRGHSAGPFSKH